MEENKKDEYQKSYELLNEKLKDPRSINVIGEIEK